MRKLSQQEFCEKIYARHGAGRYDLGGSIYINSRSRVKVKCNNCGHTWDTLAVNFLNGYGCPPCGVNVAANTQRICTQDFLSKLGTSYFEQYDFSEVVYVNNSTKIKVRCLQHDHIFLTSPADFVRGKNLCPLCACSGYKQSEAASLYVLTSEQGQTKVGITNRSAKARASNVTNSSCIKFSVIWEHRFDKGSIPPRNRNNNPSRTPRNIHATYREI